MGLLQHEADAYQFETHPSGAGSCGSLHIFVFFFRPFSDEGDLTRIRIWLPGVAVSPRRETTPTIGITTARAAPSSTSSLHQCWRWSHSRGVHCWTFRESDPFLGACRSELAPLLSSLLKVAFHRWIGFYLVALQCVGFGLHFSPIPNSNSNVVASGSIALSNAISGYYGEDVCKLAVSWIFRGFIQIAPGCTAQCFVPSSSISEHGFVLNQRFPKQLCNQMQFVATEIDELYWLPGC